MYKFVTFFIGFVFCLIIAYFVGIGFVGYKVITSDKDNMASSIGKFVGEIHKGYEQGKGE